MKTALKRSVFGAVAATAIASAVPANAQTYPIDCAILLCLAGGWPASAECTAARAEFIRRVTPWPVEPPLQIWRCPMGGTGVQLQNGFYQTPIPEGGPFPLLDGLAAPVTINASMDGQDSAGPVPAVVRTLESADFEPSQLLRFIQDYTDDNGTADIDISGPEFDFVRSIRVYHVRMLTQQWVTRRDDEECSQMVLIDVGQYGTQGDFHWRRGSWHELPADFHSTEGMVHNPMHQRRDCPTVNASRNVFLDWRDHEGTYGFEQVRY